MKIGFTVGIWNSSRTVEEFRDLVLAAEQLGYDSVWAGEGYGNDALTPLAWTAAQTSRVRLGTSVLQMPARSPAMTAMSAATLDRLSGGRFDLGLGVSGPQVAEGLHGQRSGHPLTRTREYVQIVRMALGHETIALQGKVFELPLPNGPGKALRLMISPVQDPVPIYLAANGPRNMSLAGEIADGILPTLLTPDGVRTAWTHVRAGAAKAGRATEGFSLIPTIKFLLDEDPERARERARPYLARLIGGMGTREQNYYNNAVARAGFEEAADRIRSLYLGGDRRAAQAAVPDELIDAVTLVGPAAHVQRRLEAYRAAGATGLLVSTLADGLENEMEQLELMAAVTSRRTPADASP